LTYELASDLTDNLIFGILMPVVADCNLKDYMATHHSDIQSMPANIRDNLQKWFGCLAVGLEFIHSNRVRHMDIKPANILIKDDLILYSDFGISKEFKSHERTTTDGPPGPVTRLYCAPEAIGDAGSERNSKTDIFSLGCVYMEMLTVLFGKSVGEFENSRGPEGNRAYRMHINESLDWLEGLQRHAESEHVQQNVMERMLPLCNRMTLMNLRDRPSSGDIVDDICGLSRVVVLNEPGNCSCRNNFSIAICKGIYPCGPDCCYRPVTPVTPVTPVMPVTAVTPSRRSFWTCCHCENFHDIKIWEWDCPICGHHMDDACSMYSNTREGLCERGIYETNEEYLVREWTDD